MAKKEDADLAKLLSVCIAVRHQARPLTLNEVTKGLREAEGSFTVTGYVPAPELKEGEEAPEPGAPGKIIGTIVKHKDRAEPLAVKVELDGDTFMNYASWKEFRDYMDAAFLADMKDMVPHFCGYVLAEFENVSNRMREHLAKRVEKVNAKLSEAEDLLDEAEKPYLPDTSKPYGPLFGDAPVDMELEEFEPEPEFHPVEIWDGKKVKDPQGLGRCLQQIRKMKLEAGVPWRYEEKDTEGSYLSVEVEGELAAAVWQDRETNEMHLWLSEGDSQEAVGADKFLQTLRQKFPEPEPEPQEEAEEADSKPSKKGKKGKKGKKAEKTTTPPSDKSKTDEVAAGDLEAEMDEMAMEVAKEVGL